MATGNAPPSVPGTMATGEQRCSLSRSAFDLNDLKYQIYYEYENTKSDLFNHFNLDLKSEVSKSEQFWSGSVFFKNNDFLFLSEIINCFVINFINM